MSYCKWNLIFSGNYIWIKEKISNITSYFQVVKSTANVSVDSEQILGENIVVNESAMEIRIPDKPSHANDYMCFLKGRLESKIDFVIQNCSNCHYGLTMMK